MLGTALLDPAGGRLHLVVDLEPSVVAEGSEGPRGLAVMYQAIDSNGKVVAQHRDVLHLTGATIKSSEPVRVKYITEFPIRPGHYQVRLAAMNRGTSEIGSAFGDIEVPDLSRSKTAMTGILLAARPQDRWFLADSDDSTRGKLPWPSTNVREFQRGTPVVAYAQVSACGRSEICRVDAAVISDSGNRVFQRSEQIPLSRLGIAGGIVQQLPVDLAVGEYVLELKVSPSNTAVDALTRRLRFAIK